MSIVSKIPEHCTAVVLLMSRYMPVCIDGDQVTILAAPLSAWEAARSVAQIFADAQGLLHETCLLSAGQQILTVAKKGGGWQPAALHSDRLALLVKSSASSPKPPLNRFAKFGSRIFGGRKNQTTEAPPAAQDHGETKEQALLRAREIAGNDLNVVPELEMDDEFVGVVEWGGRYAVMCFSWKGNEFLEGRFETERKTAEAAAQRFATKEHVLYEPQLLRSEKPILAVTDDGSAWHCVRLDSDRLEFLDKSATREEAVAGARRLAIVSHLSCAPTLMIAFSRIVKLGGFYAAIHVSGENRTVISKGLERKLNAALATARSFSDKHGIFCLEDPCELEEPVVTIVDREGVPTLALVLPDRFEYPADFSNVDEQDFMPALGTDLGSVQ